MSSIPLSWQNSKGINIYAQEWRPSGEPRGVVALVHGLGEHSGRYQHVAEALNAAGYGMIGFDLPGHGQSAGVRGHAAYDEILDDIDCLLTEAGERYPGKRRFLYGHSLGGALVLYYTLKRKPGLNGVIASAPGLVVGAPVAAPKLLLAKVMAKLAPTFTMENGLDVNNLSHDPALVQAYKDDPLVHPRISARLGTDLLTKGSWIMSHAAEFPVPLLLIQGSGDRLVSPQANAAFAKLVPADKITYKVWEGFYHESHNEPEKAQVLQVMIGWLDGRA